MKHLKDFFDAERKRIFTPGSSFTTRVMARVNGRIVRESGIWDIVPGSVRPVMALALVLILCFLAVELILPQIPQRGFVEAYMEPEQTADEGFLYSETDVPTGQEFLEHMISLEDGQ